MRFYLTIPFFILTLSIFAQTDIPLPEHPRPDWQRSNWLNLNGDWSFQFDKEDVGLKKGWAKGTQKFPLTIKVPFPWGSKLSGVKDEADIAWYQRTVTVPKEWKGQRVFVVIGASDYKTTVWLDGKELGSFEGGYVPFEFELSSLGLKAGAMQKLVIRVDDKRRDYALYGKQGYGNARGIWQTIYLEARAKDYLETLHFSPDIDNSKVKVTATLPQPASQDLELKLNIAGLRPGNVPTQTIAKGQTQLTFEADMPNFKLWTLENPFLYEVEANLTASADRPQPPLQVERRSKASPQMGGLRGADGVNTYFGMRKISVVNLPETNYPYVALNNQPIYLQLTLDQSYHPDGFYTFPTDEFMKNEIKLAKDIGLNGIRTHIKIDVPRKLYWADRLGLLVMSDLPNFWGQPNAEARAESERVLPQLIKRDFNHPAIFSWIIFNETWGLRTKVEDNGKKVNKYLPETQQWVASMYRKAKALDPTRLVEDNSICCGAGHTETDINSWHEYLPGYGWEDYLKNLTSKTFEGSTFNFEKGYAAGKQPNINSEFGNVWGYDGSAGDVDWTWDYHRSVNAFRKYPLVAGWLYTEHHDVINEWNGYFKFDRTQKFTGLEAFVQGMTLKDLHADIYVTTGQDISKSVRATEVVQVPLTISSMTGRTDLGNELTLKVELNGWDAFGQEKKWHSFTQKIAYKPWMQQALAPIYVIMPTEKSVAVLSLVLEDAKGNILSRNFNTYIVEKPQANEMVTGGGQKLRLLTIAPKNFSDAKWSQKQWNVLDGLKVNGAGAGYFEYKIKWPTDLKTDNVGGASFIMEASAKQLFGKDRDNAAKIDGDYMLGGGTADNSRNPNAYPMTDEYKFPSDVAISFNGIAAGKLNLPDDPADHRGVLSWHYQPQDKKLREAGSYGYRVEVNVPAEALQKAIQTGELVLRLAVEGNGGLAIYGEKFGMYPFEPTVIVKVK
ncbi:glycoside hydrolase family 2 protein [Runella sp.]|uniref:glycoside hydrolase family 2 protein n=1 Tax=Runella sp. TaxID=1960881 RepID=UPI00261033C0|nr:sugar-binding domain-containing protein [Runella sp.]